MKSAANHEIPSKGNIVSVKVWETSMQGMSQETRNLSTDNQSWIPQNEGFYNLNKCIQESKIWIWERSKNNVNKAKFVKKKARKEVHLFRKGWVISYIVLDILTGENLCVVALCVITCVLCAVWSAEAWQKDRRKIGEGNTHPSNYESN